jgi:hypothetical protein
MHHCKSLKPHFVISNYNLCNPTKAALNLVIHKRAHKHGVLYYAKASDPPYSSCVSSTQHDFSHYSTHF